jgi:A/G-specific adenine glycosylase
MIRPKPEAPQAQAAARDLSLALDVWYRANARKLPWRLSPAERDAGATPDPYRVWLSEVMLQQTTVPHAAPYYAAFLQRWPTIETLAAADWEEVAAAWAGLGYYSRARNLHACAKAVVAQGGFPHEPIGLRALPGVGPYTAAAVAAIAFDLPVAPVDGNIERVMSRIHAIPSDRTEAGWRAAKQAVAARAQALFESLGARPRPGDLAQALMDLGATVCTPRSPACTACPLFEVCAARREGAPERYPMKPDKSARPVRRGAAYVALRLGAVLLARRPPKGLLGGMLMPLTDDWTGASADPERSAPDGFAWRRVGAVRHTFTHFDLELDVYRAEAGPDAPTPDGAAWMTEESALTALPTVGRKAVQLALKG